MVTMIRSMTGFGRAESERGNDKFTVEMKSVNNRFLDVSVRMPKIFNPYEASLREIVKRYAERGKIDIYVNYEHEAGSDVVVTYNKAVAKQYADALKEMAAELGIDGRIGIHQLAGYPDVLVVKEEDPDQAALLVFSAVYGGGTSSKLFRNVRERLQLCYHAGSLVDLHKGLLLASAGIDFDKLDSARDEIFAQLEAMRRGEISEEELDAARACVASDLRAMCDSQGELEGFYLAQTLDGLDCSPLELAALAEDVSKEDVVRIAQSVDCDLIYFLKGGEQEEADGD